MGFWGAWARCLLPPLAISREVGGISEWMENGARRKLNVKGNVTEFGGNLGVKGGKGVGDQIVIWGDILAEG